MCLLKNEGLRRRMSLQNELCLSSMNPRRRYEEIERIELLPASWTTSLQILAT